MTITVLLADDQALVRSGLRMLLDAEADFQVVAEASDGREAVELAAQYRPDVAVMDVRMPVLDGIAATERIMADQRNRTRVLVLTTFDVEVDVQRSLNAGAAGFLLKDASADDLVRAINTVAAGGSVIDPHVLRRLLKGLAAPTVPAQDAQRAHIEETLTSRELEVLRLVARGLTNQEIAAQLTISPATAKTHVSNVLTKLDLRDRVHATVLAHEAGIAP